MDFSETIAASDVKVGRSRHLIMTPTSKKLRRHIGLGLSCLSVRLYAVTLALGQELLEIGS